MAIRQKFHFKKSSGDAHRILQRYSFYGQCPPEAQQALVALTEILSCESGQTLYGDDRPCDKVVLVGSGSIRVYVAGQSGREFTLYRISPGQICPVNIQSACHNAGVVADAAAASELEAAVIPADRFRAWLDSAPHARQYLFEATFNRFIEMIGRIRAITTYRIDDRLARFLLREFRTSDSPRPVLVMTQEDIAGELGTVREVVGRRLQKLEQAGAIEIGRGRIWLEDRDRLRETLDASPGVSSAT